MTHTGILTRVEIESMGPPVLEELREADVPASFLCDLALKHVAQMPEPTTRSISEELRLPRALVEEMGAARNLAYRVAQEAGRASEEAGGGETVGARDNRAPLGAGRDVPPRCRPACSRTPPPPRRRA